MQNLYSETQICNSCFITVSQELLCAKAITQYTVILWWCEQLWWCNSAADIRRVCSRDKMCGLCPESSACLQRHDLWPIADGEQVQQWPARGGGLEDNGSCQQHQRLSKNLSLSLSLMWWNSKKFWFTILIFIFEVFYFVSITVAFVGFYFTSSYLSPMPSFKSCTRVYCSHSNPNTENSFSKVLIRAGFRILTWKRRENVANNCW